MITRAQYLPKNAEKVHERQDINAVVYYTRTADKIGAIGFHGKSQKPDFLYIFKSEEQRQAHVEKYFNDLKTSLEFRNERKVQNKKLYAEFLKSLKPGVILFGTWGYDQTNVDFYIIKEVKASKVLIQELSHTTVEGSEGHMSDRVVPGMETDERPIWKQVRANRIRINDCISLRIYEPKPDGVYRSWYA